MNKPQELEYKLRGILGLNEEEKHHFISIYE
jgi:hypothetical protein